jgi:uncharacterized protein
MFTQEISVTDQTFDLMEETSNSTTVEKPNAIGEAVMVACERVTPMWPLTNFIATNPLKGYETYPFEEAVGCAEKYFHGKALPGLDYLHEQFRKGRITTDDLAAALKGEPGEAREKLVQVLSQEAEEDDRVRGPGKPARDKVFLLPTECIDQVLGTRLYSWSQGELVKWCASYFDLGQATWPMPGKETNGFYNSWKRLAVHDRSFELAGVKGFRKFVQELPDDSLKAIEALCSKLSIPHSLLPDYFARHLAAMPGWSGLFAYKGSEMNFLKGADKNAELMDWLAVRLSYDVAGTTWAANDLLAIEPTWNRLVDLLRKRAPQTEKTVSNKPKVNVGLVWLKAFEHNYRAGLIKALKPELTSLNRRAEPHQKRPIAQTVFCIDVRSEGLRRHLEQRGNYDTYGFAGFFAIPLAFRELGTSEISAQCPVLLRPKYLVDELSHTPNQKGEQKQIPWKKASSQLGGVLKEVKSTSLSPFSFVEALGGLGAAGLAFRGFLPSVVEKSKKALHTVLGFKRKTVPSLEGSDKHDLYTSGIPFSDRVAIAENSLRFMGLTSNFGKIVLLCGHGSDTQNNPYASSLDCGACGGHRGAPNARVAAAIFNSPEVRAQLNTRGISIPKDTWFVAAEHNTTNDVVEILDEWSIPAEFADSIAQVKADIGLAGESLNLERAARFGGETPKNEKLARAEVQRRTQDWSEVRPEWGLAGNATFIIGRRQLTKNLNLGCRSFLHSYRWEIDGDGSALEVIMTAPMIVTQWINSQYYFSTVDNQVFGSGNKTIHNVVGKLGVMQGNVSDLKIGLPEQSVSDGENLQHEPMRLLVVIEAPCDRIRQIALKHDSVKRLVENEWIRIVAADASQTSFQYLDKDLEWQKE